MFRKGSAVVLALAVALVAAACSGAGGPGSAGGSGGKEPVKIGMLIEQTGFFSWYGKENQYAAELFAEQWNADGDRVPLELSFYDTASNPENAVSGFKKFADSDKVHAIVGLGLVNEAMAVAPMAKNGPILYSLSGAYRPEGDYVFGGTVFAADMQRKAMEFLKEKGIKSFSLITTNDDTGQQAATASQAIAESLGLTLTSIEYFNASDVSVTSQITKIKNSDAEAVVAWVVGKPLGVVFQGIQQVKLDLPVVSSHGNLSPGFLKSLADSQPEELYVPATKDIGFSSLGQDDPQYDEIKAFRDAYVAKFGEEPGLGSGTTWDTLTLLMNAFTEKGTTPQAAKEYLEQVSGHVGVAGVYHLAGDDHRGLSAKDAVILRVVNGEFELEE